MRPSCYSVINSTWFDIALYICTVSMAYGIYGMRHEISLVSVPASAAAACMFFPVLCGMFITKHIYRDRILAIRRDNMIEAENYSSEIEGLNSDISGLKAEIIRARQQTDLKSALIGDLKKEMRGVREKLGEKEMGDRTLAYNVLQMLMELFLKAAEHAGGGPMEKTVIITGERLEALREDLLSGRLSNSEFIAAAFGLFDRILDIQAGTRPGKIPGPAMKGSCAWGLNPGMDAAEAQKVYKFLRVAFHPDRFHASRHVTVADRMFKEIDQVYAEFMSGRAKMN